MALKKIKGPLSIEDGGDVEATDPEVTGEEPADTSSVNGPLSAAIPMAGGDYNKQMAMLMGKLIKTPEQEKKDELLAWGGGFTSTNNDLGSNIVGANAAQSKYRLEEDKLRAQYIPLIMNALGAGQAAAGTAADIASLGQIDFRGMPEGQVAALSVKYKRDLKPLWEAANFGVNRAAGSYDNRLTGKNADGTPNVTTNYNMDPSKPVVPVPLPGGGIGVGVAPYGVESNAALAGAAAEATTQGQKKFQEMKWVDKDNIEHTALMPELFPNAFKTKPTPTPDSIRSGSASGTVAPSQAGNGPGNGPASPAKGGRAPLTMAEIQEALKGLPAPQKDVAASSGSAWTGDSMRDLTSIVDLKDPQERANALQSYTLFNQAQQGAKPPVATAPASTGPGFQSGPNPKVTAQAANLKEDNTVWKTKVFEPVIAQSTVAANNLDSIKQQRQALTEIGKTGWGAENIGAAKKVFSSLGMSDYDDAASGLGKFQQALMTNVFNGLSTQTGVQTKDDAERMQRTFATLENTPKANAYLLDLAEAKAQRDIAKAKFFQKMLPIARDGSGDYTSIQQAWEKRQPSIFTYESMKKWN